MLELERELWAKGFTRVAGVDEAGRGPLAGCVMTAAVIINQNNAETLFDSQLSELTDSKQLTEKTREGYFRILTSHPAVLYSIAQANVEEIDRLNIRQATHLAMKRALNGLTEPADAALIDGRDTPALTIPGHAIIKGDSKSMLIAAASVLAKVSRDRLMAEYDRTYPEYGFAQHKGYGTKQHLEAIKQHGPCPIHRTSFAPVRMMDPTQDLFAFAENHEHS